MGGHRSLVYRIRRAGSRLCSITVARVELPYPLWAHQLTIAERAVDSERCGVSTRSTCRLQGIKLTTHTNWPQCLLGSGAEYIHTTDT